MPKGAKHGGRKAGVPNKLTMGARESVMDVFRMLGGPDGMFAWAKDNPADFYKNIWVKVIPTDVQAKVVHQFEPLVITQHVE